MQLADYSESASLVPIKIMDNVIKVEASELSTFCITDDYTLWATGYNNDGSLGIGNKENQNGFVKVCDNVKDVKCGQNFVLILKNDGTLSFSGTVDEEYEPQKTKRVFLTPFQFTEGVLEIATTYTCCFYLKQDGRLYEFGLNLNMEFSNIIKSNVTYSNPQLVYSNVKHLLSECNDELYFETRNKQILVLNKNGITQIDSSLIQVSGDLSLKNDGTVWGKGYGYGGAFGIGPVTELIREPVYIMDEVKSIASVESHSLFLKDDGSLYVSGGYGPETTKYGKYADLGFIGDGSTEPRLTPVFIMDNIEQVEVGKYTSFAIDSNGSLWGWGLNNMTDMLLYY